MCVSGVIFFLRSSFSKLFNRSKVEGKDGEGSQTRSKVEGKEGEGSQKRVSSLMAEWEVVESSSVAQTSPSPEMIKKPPPVVKEKPRNKPTSSASTEKNLTQDGKKVAILPSSQMASLANVLQKGVLKPNKVNIPYCIDILRLDCKVDNYYILWP